MGYVRVTKKKIVISNACWDFRMGAAMNGGIFAKNIVDTNFQMCRLADVLEILRFTTNRRKSEKFIVGTNGARSLDDYVRVKHTTVAKRDSSPNDTIGSDRDVRAELGRR